MKGKLEIYCGGMFAEKSTNLLRQAKRHMLAGRKVVIIKPDIDNRYAADKVVTHDGSELAAVVLNTSTRMSFRKYLKIKQSDVVLIDEVQFFEEHVIRLVNDLLEEGKTVYAAGLDMDKEGKPFEITSHLMAIAEEVHKVKAVCRDCGNDSWVTVETKKQEGRVNIGNDYKPVCRSCSYNYIGTKNA